MSTGYDSAKAAFADWGVDAEEAMHEYGISLTETPDKGAYDGVVLAVGHDTFRDQGLSSLHGYGSSDYVLCDLKSVFGPHESDLRL